MVNRQTADLLATLRDRSTATADFRRKSDELARLLCADALASLGASDDATSGGVMLVPVLRAGLALLPAFAGALPGAPVAFIGIARDEETAQPDLYYTRFPTVTPPRALIIDPMLATAGTACLVAEILMREGYSADSIHFVGVLASREGMDRLAGVIPRANISVVAVDPGVGRAKVHRARHRRLRRQVFRHIEEPISMDGMSRIIRWMGILRCRYGRMTA